ncbi:hypothetical protein [Peristeroidobacter soli]|uniref:hypothetical protein n=1 Tax=Peristeroidobacter soli TaxID=2497877 RepID=UPI00101CE94B|nr:hypothetical protein [Peristeroidobacter soli]
MLKADDKTGFQRPAPTAQVVGSSRWLTSGCFVESLLTELTIASLVRTRRPFFKSRPGTVLLVSTLILAALTAAIPCLAFVAAVSFVPITHTVVGTLMIVTLAYVMAAELTGSSLYRGTRTV